jgi:hypothetical protein
MKFFPKNAPLRKRRATNVWVSVLMGFPYHNGDMFYKGDKKFLPGLIDKEIANVRVPHHALVVLLNNLFDTQIRKKYSSSYYIL